jgi:hypothetical protein
LPAAVAVAVVVGAVVGAVGAAALWQQRPLLFHTPRQWLACVPARLCEEGEVKEGERLQKRHHLEEFSK